MNENDLLEQAIINQIEKDLEENDYDAISEMLRQLIHLEPAKKILVGYLSDEIKEQWIDGKIQIKY